MVVEPDLEGFRAAQVTLRQQLGEDVPFFTPTATTFPEGTPLDPESGLPFDPTVLPTASGFASASVRASVFHRPIRGTGDQTISSPIGNIEEGEVVVTVAPDDYAEQLSGATEMEVHGERYKITQSEEDQLGEGEPHRMILHGKQL